MNRWEPFTNSELLLIAGGLCKMFSGLAGKCDILDQCNMEIDRRNYERRRAGEPIIQIRV